MNTQQLFKSLNSASLRVKLRPDQKLEVVGDLSKLTEDMKIALRENRQVFIGLLEPTTSNDISVQSVRLGSEDFVFSNWEPGEQLRSPIAIDTETEWSDGNDVRRLALVSVSDGAKHRLLKPEQLQIFIDQHSDAHFIAQNAAFDFEVIRKALRDPIAWVDVADQGRLHDTMILDALIRLARDDSSPYSRDLGTLAQSYLEVVVDKDDPFRRRYSELIGRPWDEVDPGFFSYAIKDAIVTRKLWDVLSAIASKLIKPFAAELLPEAKRRFGLLTESLQVRGAIALGQIERNGISLDREQVETTKAKLSDEVASTIRKLENLPEVCGLFKRSKTGELILTASRKPSVNKLRLGEILDDVAVNLQIADVPRTEKTKEISHAMKYWSQHSEHSPFLSLWVQLEEASKLCQFFKGLTTTRIHPRYSTLVRTGRTSCSKPNIQQLPRAGGFREMIVPSPGYVFLGIDYAAIELRTLAAICEKRYGRSQLADVIRQGIDPHSFTASMFEGVSLEKFSMLPAKKQLRQQAKALNFGIPGGLGAKSLVDYAAATYNVMLTIEQASSFRDRLIQEVYPELTNYLKEDAVASLARNLETSAYRVRAHFDTDAVLGAAKRIVAGKNKASGDVYGKGFVDRIWNSLGELNQCPKLANRIASRATGELLSKDLFNSPVATITGRLRGKVGYTQSRNTPFQGLAADGAKIALWDLYRAGYRSVAFVHDEVLIELPINADHTAEAARIDRILCDAMQKLTGSVPIACEYALSDRWYKEAEAVVDEDGRLQRWEPEQ